MKLFGTILIAGTSLLKGWAAEGAKPIAAANAVVITTGYIDRLVAEARTNNPSLKAAGSRVRSATLNAEAVRTWEDPMAMLAGNVFSPQGFLPRDNGDLVYGIQEKLPLWGIPNLNRQVAKAGMSTRQAQADARLQQLRRDISKALISAALTVEVVNLEEQDLEWLKATSQAVETKYRAGQVDVADTLQIQNAAAVRNDQLRTDRLELTHDQFILNRLLNRQHDSPWPLLKLPPIVPPVPYSAKLVALALANEPDLKVAAQEIKQAEATAKRTKRARLPDVTAGIQGWQYSGDGGFRQGMFTLSVSLPWFNGGKYRKDYARDQENVESAQEEREDRALLVREELHHFAVELDAKRRQALLYSSEVSIRAEQALKDKLALWETGRATLRDVLAAHRDALDAKLMTVLATAEQYKIVADLILLSGLESFESLVPLSSEPALLPNHDDPTHRHE